MLGRKKQENSANNKCRALFYDVQKNKTLCWKYLEQPQHSGTELLGLVQHHQRAKFVEIITVLHPGTAASTPTSPAANEHKHSAVQTCRQGSVQNSRFSVLWKYFSTGLFCMLLIWFQCCRYYEIKTDTSISWAQVSVFNYTRKRKSLLSKFCDLWNYWSLFLKTFSVGFPQAGH